jgi:AcrR family transcriptional regulator
MPMLLHLAPPTGRRRETFMKGPRTRAAILEAAAEAFTVSGYEVTTLDQIADRLGLTRGTVLFHFESKRALLMAIVEPLFADLDALLTNFEQYRTPLTPGTRRRMFTAYVGLLIAHRPATILLVRDLTTIIQLHWPAAGPEVASRLLALLAGPDPDRNVQIRAKSAIGGVMHVICLPPFDPAEFDDEARDMIVNSALAACAAKPNRQRQPPNPG